MSAIISEVRRYKGTTFMSSLLLRIVITLESIALVFFASAPRFIADLDDRLVIPPNYGRPILR
jgi:hypothetical protein